MARQRGREKRSYLGLGGLVPLEVFRWGFCCCWFYFYHKRQLQRVEEYIRKMKEIVQCHAKQEEIRTPTKTQKETEPGKRPMRRGKCCERRECPRGSHSKCQDSLRASTAHLPPVTTGLP